VLDIVVGVAALGVGADEPLALGVGLLQIATVAVDLGPDPASEERVLGSSHGSVGGLLGLVPLSAQVQHLGSACEEVGLLRAVLEGFLDDGQRLVILAEALQRPAQTDRGSRSLPDIPGERLVLFAGVLVIPLKPMFAGSLQRWVRGRHGYGSAQ